MPFAVHGAVRLYWKLEGRTDAPPLVLLNSIGTDMGSWDAVLPALLERFRVLRIDTRGHGASDAPDGDYALGQLASDVRTVMDAAGIAAAAVAGVSLGGMIAMELALAAPERVTALLLVCSSAAMDRTAWAARVDTVRREGMAAVVELAMGRFLSPEFAAAHPAVADGLRFGLLGTRPAGYAGAGAAIRDMELLPRLAAVRCSTLVVAGNRDRSTPFAEHGRLIAEAVPGARVVHLAAAHLAPLEAPDALGSAIIRFLCDEPAGTAAEEAAADTLFAAGLRHRRRVLGDDWVDRSLAARTPFNAEFQAMITRIAWQEIWGRPGLDDRTRRLITLAVTASLGRWEEFRLHVRAGLSRGGFDQDALKEVLMQIAIYAGVPAANTGFAEAASIIDALAAAADRDPAGERPA